MHVFAKRKERAIDRVDIGGAQRRDRRFFLFVQLSIVLFFDHCPCRLARVPFIRSRLAG